MWARFPRCPLALSHAVQTARCLNRQCGTKLEMVISYVTPAPIVDLSHFWRKGKTLVVEAWGVENAYRALKAEATYLKENINLLVFVISKVDELWWRCRWDDTFYWTYWLESRICLLTRCSAYLQISIFCKRTAAAQVVSFFFFFFWTNMQHTNRLPDNVEFGEFRTVTAKRTCSPISKESASSLASQLYRQAQKHWECFWMYYSTHTQFKELWS